MSKDELLAQIERLKAEAFPQDKPANGEKYKELKKAEDQLVQLERKEAADALHADFTKQEAERKKEADLVRAGMGCGIYQNF